MQGSDPAEPAVGARPTYPGPVIRITADYCWRLIVIGVVVYFAVELMSKVSVTVVPFMVALLVSSLLHPLAVRLRRHGLSRGVSTVVAFLAAVVVLGGLITLVVLRAAQQAPQLGNEINNLLPQVKHWLITGPLKLDPTTINNLNNTITQSINRNSSAIASTALSTGKTVLTFLEGLLLIIFSSIFLIYDGDRVWAFLLKGVPINGRPAVDAAGHAAWNTISYYIRGTLIVAVFHGVVVAITLTVLGVPLAFPLAVLVALGSFVPLVGAVLTGVLAVGVAGLAQGLVAAIVMTAVLLLDNQIEAHVLQPFVVGRYVRIHPLAVVMSLAAAGTLFGLVGAFIAVPVVATANAAARAAAAIQSRPEVTGVLLAGRKGADVFDATHSPPPGSPLDGYSEDETGHSLDAGPGALSDDGIGEPLMELHDPPQE
jgi:predicted PurR-regulated permease PerM